MYKKNWFKIHLILGVTAGVILLVIGLTGSILSFEKEILDVVNKKSHIVEVPKTEKLTTSQLLTKFKEKFPKAKINGITFSQAKDSSVIINIAGGKGRAARRGINYYVNPYTSEILPSIQGHGFFKFIENIHRRLAMGEVGKQIVGASTLCLFLLMFSGVYLYWKKMKKSFLKSFTFSFDSKGRGFLASMHSSFGLWMIPMYLVVSITGLYWSYSWFNTGLYKLAGVEKPQRMKRGQNTQSTNKNQKAISYNEIENVVILFNQNVQEYEKASLKFSSKKGIYTIYYIDESSTHPRARNTITISADSSTIQSNKKFIDLPLNERLMKSIYALHTGEYFGIIGKIIMFISSLIMVLFTVTGVMMYQKRNKNSSEKIR